MGLQTRERLNDGENLSDSPIRYIENEWAIIAAAKNGQTCSFELLIARYEQQILLQAMRITRNWQDAEDVRQQSILKAFTQLHSFQGKSSFSTWLFRIAVNEALMLLRKKRSSREVPTESSGEPNGEIKVSQILPSSPSADEYFLAQERKRSLYAALEQLTPALRSAIQLRELEERSTRETARILGISLSAVKSRVFQGRRRLRELLARDPRMRGVAGTPAARRSKRTIHNHSGNTSGNMHLRSGRKPVPHSHSLYPFPVGMLQAPQIPMEGGM